MKGTCQWTILLFLSLICFNTFAQKIRIPIETTQQQNIDLLKLTEIGDFGLARKDRPGVKGHLHTGIDIKRPGSNYQDNPIYPVAKGMVISKRDDGAFAQLIIEHHENGFSFWTVYEHIAGIHVKPGDVVYPEHPIARFMNAQELNRYGRQFDHFHFEVLKIPPLRIQPGAQLPQRHFSSYTLITFTAEELRARFYHPTHFLENLFERKTE